MELLDKQEIEDIINEFEEGISLRTSAKKRKIPISKIRRSLAKLGGDKGKEILIKELEMTDKVPIIEIAKEYQQNKPAIQICSDYNISTGKLNSIIHKYESIIGKKVTTERQMPQFRNDLNREQIVCRYRAGEYMTKIAKDNNVAPSTINAIITKYKIEYGLEIEEEHKKNVEKQKDKMKKFKKASTESVYRVIKKYNYSFGQIEKQARKLGYIVSEETYIKALERIEIEKGKGVGR